MFVRCAREECATCRVNMEQGTSTLAVTVIEDIEHQCDYEGVPMSKGGDIVANKNCEKFHYM